MQEIDCPLCGKHNEKVAIEENGYLGRRCSDCGVIYISPRPTIDELLNLYGHGEAHTGSRAFVTASDRLNAQHNLKILRSFMSSGSILEVGAGTGAFVDEAQKNGFEPYAIELNKTEANFIREGHGVPCEEEPLSDETFGGKLFDAIYHCDVTSHFHDPVREFQKMHDRLAEGGLMVFETGNIGDLAPDQLNHFDLFQYPDHLFFFGENSIRQLLKTTGFETVEIRGYSIIPQLTLTKLALAVRDMLRRLRGQKEPSTTSAGSPGKPPVRTRGGPAKRLIRSTWDYLLHYCQFGLGAVFKGSGTPQTYICVARRS